MTYSSVWWRSLYERGRPVELEVKVYEEMKPGTHRHTFLWCCSLKKKSWLHTLLDLSFGLVATRGECALELDGACSGMPLDPPRFQFPCLLLSAPPPPPPVSSFCRPTLPLPPPPLSFPSLSLHSPLSSFCPPPPAPPTTPPQPPHSSVSSSLSVFPFSLLSLSLLTCIVVCHGISTWVFKFCFRTARQPLF